MEQDKVRVVILNYNKGDLTLKCIGYVLKQNYKNLEVIIVDNSTIEEEKKIVRENLPSGVIYIESKNNCGYAAGNNIGFKYKNSTQPKYYLVLNTDAFLLSPSIVEKLVEAIKSKPHVVALSPIIRHTKLSHIDSNEHLQVRRLPNAMELIVAYSPILRRVPGLKKHWESHVYKDIMPFETDCLLECETINGSCFLVEGLFLEKIGYLDEGTFLYQEELILGFQVKEERKKCALLTSVLVDHVQGVSTGENLGFSLELYQYRLASEKYLLRKYLKANSIEIGLYHVVRFIDYLLACLRSKKIVFKNLLKVRKRLYDSGIR